MKNGFSLIELIITIGIIGVLSLLAYPVYSNYIVKVEMTEALYDLKNIIGQIEPDLIQNPSITHVGAPSGRFVGMMHLGNNLITVGDVTYYPLNVVNSTSKTPVFLANSSTQSRLLNKFSVMVTHVVSPPPPHQYMEITAIFGDKAHSRLRGLGITLYKNTLSNTWTCLITNPYHILNVFNGSDHSSAGELFAKRRDVIQFRPLPCLETRYTDCSDGLCTDEEKRKLGLIK